MTKSLTLSPTLSLSLSLSLSHSPSSAGAALSLSLLLSSSLFFFLQVADFSATMRFLTIQKRRIEKKKPFHSETVKFRLYWMNIIIFLILLRHDCDYVNSFLEWQFFSFSFRIKTRYMTKIRSKKGGKKIEKRRSESNSIGCAWRRAREREREREREKKKT